MELNDYQKQALTTILNDKCYTVQYLCLGLGGEAGEVLDKFKKIIRDTDSGEITEESKIDIIKELGDVLWYISVLADLLDYDMDAVAQLNLNKLRDRMNRGVLGGSGDNR